MQNAAVRRSKQMLRLLWKRGLKIDFVYPFLLLSFLAPFFGHSWVLFEELNMLSVSKKTFHKSSIFVWIISITTLISPVFYLVVLLVHNNQNGAQFQEYPCNSKVLFGCQKGDYTVTLLQTSSIEMHILLGRIFMVENSWNLKEEEDSEERIYDS